MAKAINFTLSLGNTTSKETMYGFDLVFNSAGHIMSIEPYTDKCTNPCSSAMTWSWPTAVPGAVYLFTPSTSAATLTIGTSGLTTKPSATSFTDFSWTKAASSITTSATQGAYSSI